jgi:hypothetical protein
MPCAKRLDPSTSVRRRRLPAECILPPLTALHDGTSYVGEALGQALNEVLLALAAAIVKTAFKILTRDSDLAGNVTDELTDLLKDRVDGKLGQRKARRWIEDLEEIVNSRLSAFIEHELIGLADNERNATILAVADTLAKAKLSEQTLLEQDLDPLQLEGFLRAAVPGADRDLGSQARALYARLLPESCAYVISLATNLPDFQVGTFGELLRRNTAIIARLDKILELMPPQQAQSGGTLITGDEPYSSFTTAYRRQVVTRLDHLRLFGVDVFTRQYPLTLAYISLSVFSYWLTHQRTKDAATSSDGGISALTIERALARSERLFLTGPAGSGKTTILQWLAVRAARKDFPRALSAWNGYEPFFIPLRQYVDKELPSPDQFVQMVGRHITDNMPNGWVERSLMSGSALVLIDGVDELPSERHDAVRRWIHSLTVNYPACAYVITSRPGAVADNWFAVSEFSMATLAPMSANAVAAFVHQWIEALRSETVDREERQLLKNYEQPIVQTLLASRHLRELASTPLLCALLCALYYARNGELPNDRMGVYAAALDMLERRDSERGIKTTSQVGRTETRLILQDLAYWLLRNGLSDAEVDRVREQIDRAKAHLHKISVDADMVYRFLLVRSGLLQEPAVNRVCFIHRTFQEYLAAGAAIEGDNIEELISHALDPQWTQVVVMAAGHASPAQRERLLGMLVTPTRRQRGEEASRRALVAVACLETSPRVSVDLLRRIRESAGSVIPPRRHQDVDLLVKAGDIALDILAEAKVTNSSEAKMMLDVIYRLGAERGLQLMARVIQQVPEIAYDVTFLRAWKVFNPNDVGAVLADLPTLKGVAVELPGCANVVSSLQVRSVYCTAYGILPDLSCFGIMPTLEELEIHSTGVVDLRPLANKKRLLVRIVLAHNQDRIALTSKELLKRYVVGFEYLGDGCLVMADVEPPAG